MGGFFLNFGFVQDIVLILISGLACFYCWLLNRRLKGLSNLKSGVGATIVSLTSAIQDTHGAAKHTLEEITQHMNTLRHLIEKAEGQAANLEAFSIDLERDVKKAKATHNEIKACIETELSPSVKTAQDTAQTLLTTVRAIRSYTAGLDGKDGKKGGQTPDEGEISVQDIENKKNNLSKINESVIKVYGEDIPTQGSEKSKSCRDDKDFHVGDSEHATEMHVLKKSA